MNDTRALAAQALADVALRGVSLREVMERQAPRLPDSRDRALLMALVSDGARWWLRFDAALDRLLERSLREKEPRIHALLSGSGDSRIGGLGIQLVRKLMDEFRYEYVDGHNVLTIAKRC